MKEAIFVFDGGMSSHFNLEQMEAQQLEYVTRLSTTSLGALVEQLPRDQQPELWDHHADHGGNPSGQAVCDCGRRVASETRPGTPPKSSPKAEAELTRLAAVKRSRRGGMDAQSWPARWGGRWRVSRRIVL